MDNRQVDVNIDTVAVEKLHSIWIFCFFFFFNFLLLGIAFSFFSNKKKKKKYMYIFLHFLVAPFEAKPTPTRLGRDIDRQVLLQGILVSGVFLPLLRSTQVYIFLSE